VGFFVTRLLVARYFLHDGTSEQAHEQTSQRH